MTDEQKWQLARQKLEAILNNPETYDLYMNRLYGNREDKPLHSVFVKECLDKFDKGRKEHNDTWEYFCEIVDFELLQEYKDIPNYEIIKLIRNEIK